MLTRLFNPNPRKGQALGGVLLSTPIGIALAVLAWFDWRWLIYVLLLLIAGAAAFAGWMAEVGVEAGIVHPDEEGRREESGE